MCGGLWKRWQWYPHEHLAYAAVWAWCHIVLAQPCCWSWYTSLIDFVALNSLISFWNFRYHVYCPLNVHTPFSSPFLPSAHKKFVCSPEKVGEFWLFLVSRLLFFCLVLLLNILILPFFEETLFYIKTKFCFCKTKKKMVFIAFLFDVIQCPILEVLPLSQ